MATATRDTGLRRHRRRSGQPARAAAAGLGRAVIWTGLALGTALAILAITDGARLRVGGMPPWLGVVLGAVIVWALIVTAADHARRADPPPSPGRPPVRGPARQARRRSPRPRRPRARPGGDHPGCAWAGPAGRPASRQAPQMRPRGPAAGARPAARTASPETDADKRLFDLRQSGYTGPVDQDGYAVRQDTPPTGDTTMAAQPAAGPASRITPARRARHTAARTGGAMPAEWGPVIARAADFEPGNDGELLGWMGEEVSGVAGYAEALIDLYESCDRGSAWTRAMTALHDVADAAAHAAETMSGARDRFADHYELPREFAGNGGLMPHDGRWVTGDGDA